VEVVARSLRPAPPINAVLTAEGLADLQAQAAETYVDPAIIDYAVRLAVATREPGYVGHGHIKPYIAWGASPRGSVNMIHAARALAVIRGRRYVLPSDVTELAPDVLRHRIVPSFTAMAEEVTSEMILNWLLPAVPEPHMSSAAAGVSSAKLYQRPPTPARSGTAAA
jgi:MoxR-like ATPase